MKSWIGLFVLAAASWPWRGRMAPAANSALSARPPRRRPSPPRPPCLCRRHRRPTRRSARYVPSARPRREVTQIETDVTALLKQCPTYAPGRKGPGCHAHQGQDHRESVARRRTKLGQCVIRIGGKAINSALHAIVVPDLPTPQESFAAMAWPATWRT